MATKPSQEVSIGDGSLHVGDRVVYPNQGICRITGVETKQIAGHDWEMVTLSREEDGATVMVPRAKVAGIGLRKVADVAAVEEVFDQLAAEGEQAQLDWKVRHRENADRMHGGGLFGTVEVLKGLHALSRIRPLPQKERELYDNARHLLVGEIAAATSIPLHVAEDNLDYALWPPVGMKRKGRTLTPATLGPPPAGAIKVARGDDDDAADDLGFEDEEAAPAVKVAGAETDREEVDEDAPPPPPSKRPAGATRAAARAAAPPPGPRLAVAPLEEPKAAAPAKPAAPAKTAAAAPAKPAAAAPARPAAAAPAKPAAAPVKPPAAAKAPPAPARPAAAIAKPAAAPARSVAPGKPAAHARPAPAAAKAAAHAKPAAPARPKPAAKAKHAAAREKAPAKKPAASSAAKKPAAKAKSKGKR